MPEKLEQTGEKPGRLVDWNLIEQTTEKWRRQRERDYLEEVVDLNSLCWTCQRAGWECLCQWPKEVIPGIIAEHLEPFNYEWPLLRVMTCPHYWPEGQNDDFKPFHTEM